MEEAGVKENVNPLGGGLWGPSKRERKLKLGVGAQELRSRERAGVLAPIATIGNGGDVDVLDWLKDRLSQHQLASKNQLEPDSGSRHLRSLGSSAVDGELLGVLGKPSAGLSSKKLGEMAAGREHSSFPSQHSPSHSRASVQHTHSHNSVDHPERAPKNHRSSSGVQVGVKSPWPANRRVIEVYQDKSLNSQEQRDSSRRDSNAKALEIKTGAARLLARGLALKPEIEEHSKVSLNSPSQIFLSKFQLRQDEVSVKQLSPPPSSRSIGSGLWNGSKRQGTPYKRTVHHSDNSVVDQPEKNNADQQYSSKGQAVGLNLTELERARTLVTSPDKREMSFREVMVEAVQEKSPGAEDTVTRSVSWSHINEKGSQSFPTKHEEIKSRIEQHKIKLKSLYSRKPPNSGDSSRSSFGNRQGPSYTYTSPMLEKEEVASSPDVKISQCGGKNLQITVIEHEKDGGGFNVDLPYLRDVDHHESGQKINCGSRAAPCETVSKYASRHSEDSANQVFARRGSSPPPANTQSASTAIAGSGSWKWPRSGAMWSQAEAHFSPSGNVHEDDDGLKQNTRNMDITPVGIDSALLYSKVTGASSSGSSSTPCEMGNSSLDDVTVKSHKSVLPTPSAEKALSSYRLSSVNKLSRTNKRSSSLGPPLRVLKDAESCNSRISPNSAAPIIESDCSTVIEEEAEKNGRQLEYARSDARKRKAERDLSGADGDTSQILEHSTSAPASSQGKDTEIGVQAQLQSAGGPREVRSMPGERPSQHSKEEVGEFAHPPMPNKLVARATELQPRISATGRLAHSEKSSSVLIKSKVTTAAFVGRQSRSTSAQDHNEIDVPGVPDDACNRRDRRFVAVGDAAEGKLSTIGEAGLLVRAPVSEPANEIQNGNIVQTGQRRDEGCEERGPLTANLEDGRELAVDMSHDGFSFGENKVKVPIPVVPDLSNCLNSLSLEEEDMLKKDESKFSSSSSVRSSQIHRVSYSSKLTTLKSMEKCHAPPSTSYTARSAVSMDMSSRDQVSISGNQETKESAEKPPRSSPILSENSRGELSKKAFGLPSKESSTEVNVGMVPSERALDSGASTQVQQFSHGTGKESGPGASATLQKKISENAHFVWVNDKRYQKIGKVGKGGSSEVYKVIDSDCNIYAMKKINLKGREHRAAVGFYQEIEYLERLRGKRNVIQLINYEVTNRTVIREDYEEEKILEDACIYMVLEFGEIDLAGILSKKRKEMMENNEIIDDNWLRFYWKHMLLAVKTIHDERIVHADLKPANFLLVTGELKLIDFGIAKAIQSDTTHIVRDSHNMVGTVNYMSPEALMTNEIDEKGRTVKCGRASDIWSLGCILYQMVYGHTPFSQVTSFYAKIQAITSKSHKIEFPAIPDPWLQDVMRKCLIWDRYSRPQITDLLEHPFLRPGLANQQSMVA